MSSVHDPMIGEYAELRRLAHALLRGQRAGHTLQTTALVHEAYLRMIHHPSLSGMDRRRLLCTAARAMRSVLVDHARRRRADKRGGPDARRYPLDEALDLYESGSVDLVELDDALNRLAAMDGELVQLVELRFFGGMTVEETGQLLGVSDRTVRRQWQVARRWLHQAFDPV